MPTRISRRAFDHVLVIMLENQYRSYVLRNHYMRTLARDGILLANSFGVMHPSQTNYIASIAGQLCDVTYDDPPPLLPQRTIVDLIEEAPGGLRWKAYMEGYEPSAAPWTPDITPENTHPYYIKHNPFSSFARIVRNEERWRRIANQAALFADLLNGEFPEYAWFTPNIWNDGHWVAGTNQPAVPRAPALVDQAARWLEEFFAALRFPGPDSHLPPRTMVVVTYDEADFEAGVYADTYDGPNQIYTVLLGDGIGPGVEEEGYNHYSLLRTIEINFGLDHLGTNDADANWFQFLWGRRFRWSHPEATPMTGSGGLAAAGHAGALFVACAAEDGSVRVRTRAGGYWSEEELLPVDGSGGIAMASTFAELVLVARSSNGGVQSLTYDLQRGWSRAASLPDVPVPAAVAMASFDHDSRIMLALRGDDGSVHTCVRSAGQWASPVPVPAAETDGPMTLGTLGASLYLIVKTPGARTMKVISYNTAAFNVVTVKNNPYGGPHDDTTREQWSPSSFPVAHFSAGPDQAPEEAEPLKRPYETGGPMAMATLDGVMHLVHPAAENPLLMTETFSIAGLMTPSTEVSWKTEDSPTAIHSSGFGTLAEAGWTTQSPIFGAHCGPTGALAMARAGEEIVLLSRSRADAPVEMRIGRYRQESDEC